MVQGKNVLAFVQSGLASYPRAGCAAGSGAAPIACFSYEPLLPSAHLLQWLASRIEPPGCTRLKLLPSRTHMRPPTKHPRRRYPFPLFFYSFLPGFARPWVEICVIFLRFFCVLLNLLCLFYDAVQYVTNLYRSIWRGGMVFHELVFCTDFGP